MSQKAGGVNFYCDGYTVKENSTSTCKHCQRITDIPSQREMMKHVDICRQCMGLICLECAGKPCTPWQRRIDEMEKRAYQRQQLLKML